MIVANEELYPKIVNAGPGIIRVRNEKELEETILRLLRRDTPVLGVYRGSWKNYPRIKQKARLRGLNHLLYQPLDPREADAGKTHLAELVRARHELLAKSHANKAPFWFDPNKPVDRRTLLFSPHRAARSYTPGPIITAPDRCQALSYCEECVTSCPAKALNGKPPRLDPSRCIGCGLCADVCPVRAPSMPGLDLEGLQRFLKRIRSFESGPGWLVLVCIESLPHFEQVLTALAIHRPVAPVFFLPAPCPGWIGETGTIEAAAHGFTVLYACTQETLERCGGTGTVGYVLRTARLLTGKEPLQTDASSLARLLSSTPPLRGFDVSGLTRPEITAKVLESVGIEEAVFRSPIIGRVIVDPMKCTVCDVCSDSCPFGALRVEADRSEKRLVFYPEHCAACKVCEYSCPEKAIRVVYEFRGSGKRVLASDTIARCLSCGKPIGSVSLLKRLAESLRRRGAPESLVRMLWLCDECKVSGRRQK